MIFAQTSPNTKKKRERPTGNNALPTGAPASRAPNRYFPTKGMCYSKEALINHYM